ncbi:MAG: hypothetical protein GYB68_02895, partial [Chloroflexi bacterium]|nr:hypothetical protein [Chloroflexota bacterium]
MKTPAGHDCRFYHEDIDILGGHFEQGCRLVEQADESEPWQPNDCSHCTVPNVILRYAGVPDNLKAHIETDRWGNREVVVNYKKALFDGQDAQAVMTQAQGTRTAQALRQRLQSQQNSEQRKVHPLERGGSNVPSQPAQPRQRRP